jgi:hypothetical protein
LPEIECDRNTVVAANNPTAINAEIIKRIMANLPGIKTPAVAAAPH